MRTLIGLLLAICLGAISNSIARAYPGPPNGSAAGGGFKISDIESSRSGIGTGPSSPESRVVSTELIDCGSPTLAKRAIAPSQRCSTAWVQCDVESLSLLVKRRVTDLVVVRTFGDGSSLEQVECDVPVRTRPDPKLTAQMVRDQAEKLLPHPVIGSAPPGRVTLVNIETVLWIASASERRLGTVTLLGRRVEIRAHIDRVTWRFGDGASATTTGPGTAYTDRHPCRTKQCPGYFGHTYTDTGSTTITAALTWTGQFSVDGGAWQTIPGTVTAAATSTTIDVKEARGVLVPNP